MGLGVGGGGMVSVRVVFRVWAMKGGGGGGGGYECRLDLRVWMRGGVYSADWTTGLTV